MRKKLKVIEKKVEVKEEYCDVGDIFLREDDDNDLYILTLLSYNFILNMANVRLISLSNGFANMGDIELEDFTPDESDFKFKVSDIKPSVYHWNIKKLGRLNKSEILDIIVE